MLNPRRPSRPATLADYTTVPPHEFVESIPWVSILIVTSAFFLVDHSFTASVNTSFSDVLAAATKAASIGSGDLKRQVGFIAFGLYGVACWSQSARYRLSRCRTAAVMLTLFTGWAVLSLAWSTDAALTLRRLGSLALMLVGVSGMLRRFSLAQLTKLIFYLTLTYLLVGIVSELYLGVFTPWAKGYRFSGTLFPNLQGVNCAVLLFSTVALYFARDNGRRLYYMAVAVSATAFLFLTDSRGAMAGTAAALAVVWMLAARKTIRVITVIIAMAMGVAGVLLTTNGLIPSPIESLVVERTPGVGVLTGRPDLWSILLEYARVRPVLGFGYGAFFSPERGLDMAARIGTWGLAGPHSIYFGTLVDVGAVGLIVLVGMLLSAAFTGARMYLRTATAGYLGFTAIVVFYIVHGITESELFSPSPHFIPVLVIGFLAFRKDPV